MSRSLVRRGPALAAARRLPRVRRVRRRAATNRERAAAARPAQSADAGGNVTEQLFAGSAADNRKNPDQGKKGGKLTVLSAGDVDYMDPGTTYYTYAIGIMNAMHRGLYAYLPGQHGAGGARPRGRRSADLQGRQDRHREAQDGREVLPAR